MAEPAYFTPIGTFPTTASTSPTGLLGSLNGSIAARTDYYWNTVQRRVEIQNRSGHACEMYVRWNAYDANPATIYNRWLAPGDICFSPPGLAVKTMSIYFTADSPFLTNFVIQGWE